MSKLLSKLRPKLHIPLFGQLSLAFILIILLVGGGVLLAGRLVLNQFERFDDGGYPLLVGLCVEQLTGHYADQQGWRDVEQVMDRFPCQRILDIWGKEGYVVVADAEGTIVASDETEWLGQTLNQRERAWSIPLQVDDERVGFLLMYDRELSSRVRGAFQTLLILGLVIGISSLLISLLISRRISRPLVNLTAATRDVATGDLSVRVPVAAHGEMRELAIAFNQMAHDLAQADELRRNMTADVAHELRTPLSVIRGKLEGVLDGVYPATAQHLEPVLEEVRLLTRLVEDLRLLALAEAGQLALEKRPIDVGDLLRDVYVNFGPQAADRGVTLALDLLDDLPPVLADRRRISQVLGNLLTNALRYTPQGGCVTLSGTASDGVVEAAVSDTGAGIPPEDLPHVFERFWRGEKSRTRAGGGSGLGLAIAKQLVEIHGGVIGVETVPGEGSTFWFTLPAT